MIGFSAQNLWTRLRTGIDFQHARKEGEVRTSRVCGDKQKGLNCVLLRPSYQTNALVGAVLVDGDALLQALMLAAHVVIHPDIAGVL